MAKRKTTKPITATIYHCSKCNESIEQGNELHCKVYIKDLTLPFSSYSLTTTKKDCPYYKEKNV
ncbi:hypothetical protein [Aliarcobacter butzleri]|uniref:hypothetical protein n=1 Tax=Aliarcobacter butzleri TaxID=28197 RepID=UPI00158730C7|nr:hypothetical protein [Aliarcobacter butzleri]MCT7643884.1 hypothetical protein [Aliarcobacter butzleri]NUW28947.1 hypothetical protein [Aliarcobacter butzleri]